jgi:hypothetical protein
MRSAQWQTWRRVGVARGCGVSILSFCNTLVTSEEETSPCGRVRRTFCWRLVPFAPNRGGSVSLADIQPAIRMQTFSREHDIHKGEEGTALRWRNLLPKYEVLQLQMLKLLQRWLRLEVNAAEMHYGGTLDQNTGYLNQGLPWFSSAPPGKWRIVHRLRHDDRFLLNPLISYTQREILKWTRHLDYARLNKRKSAVYTTSFTAQAAKRRKRNVNYNIILRYVLSVFAGCRRCRSDFSAIYKYTE